jgi:hypothetical protein
MSEPTEPSTEQLQEIARTAVAGLAVAARAVTAISPALAPRWSYDDGMATGYIPAHPDAVRALEAWRRALPGRHVITRRTVQSAHGERQIWAVSLTVADVPVRLTAISPVMIPAPTATQDRKLVTA